MSETFATGDRVLARFDGPGQEDWSAYPGVVIEARAQGPLNPQRTVRVKFDEPVLVWHRQFRQAWFKPEQLERA